MNLKTIREKIKNVSDYSPEVLAYDNQMDSIINDAYYSIWTERRWEFAQKLSFMNVYPDITSTRAGNITASTKDGQRIVTFSGLILGLHDTNEHIWVGNIFEIGGREYTILKVYDDGTITTIILTEPVRHKTTAATIASQTDWIIKCRFYHMPHDMIEVFNLAHRDAPVPSTTGPNQGKAIGLSRRREEDLNLREDKTSNFAEAYITVPPIVIPSGEKLRMTVTDVGTSAINAGSFASNKSYEFCWANISGGRMGPLSDPTIISTPSGVKFYFITAYWETWDDQYYAARAPNEAIIGMPRPFEGLKKVLYYNANFDDVTGARRGLPSWRAVTDFDRSATKNKEDDQMEFSDTSISGAVRHPQCLQPGSPLYKENDGIYERIRPYPRIDNADFTYPSVMRTYPGTSVLRIEEKFRQMECRYFFKPEKLLNRTDTPQMPFEFHSLIVYKALEDIFIKSGNTSLASHYAVRVALEIKKAERRYIQHTDVNYRRGQFSSGGQASAWFNPDTLSTTG